LKQLIALQAAECKRRSRNVCAPKSLSEAVSLIGGGEAATSPLTAFFSMAILNERI
jgi:hypothetical protein